MKGGIDRVGLIIHTVRYLRPVQIYGRIWHRLYRPRPDRRPAPHIREPASSFLRFSARPPSLHGPGHFRFLNQEGAVEQAVDWNSPVRDKLWLYNLHYFDDLNAREARKRLKWHRALIDRWITENPPGCGNGWEPYPTSLRIVNWIKWALAGNPLAPAWTQSLAVQIRWLAKKLEWHLLGNHLFANAKALVFAGLFFKGDEAAAWLERGMRILARQIPAQILPDGGQFELSPMYHALAVEDLLDLINIAQACHTAMPEKWQRFTARWPARATTMREWLSVMSHQDGEISFFNDAAIGISAPPSALNAYGVQLGLAAVDSPSPAMVHLNDSGYIRVRYGPLLALLDVAAIGPDYLPGHAHADTLTFELSMSGQRFVVNSGTSVYGTGQERIRQRSTAAHNTVEVDGENSSEVWGGFRAARRASPGGLSIQQSGEKVSVTCSHDGYLRLPGRVTHSRQWRFSSKSLRIRDSLSGSFERAIARFHFHPDVNPAFHERRGTVTATGGRMRCKVVCGQPRVVPSSYHPQFGVSVPNRCLEVIFTEPHCEVEFSWS